MSLLEDHANSVWRLPFSALLPIMRGTEKVRAAERLEEINVSVAGAGDSKFNRQLIESYSKVAFPKKAGPKLDTKAGFEAFKGLMRGR